MDGYALLFLGVVLLGSGLQGFTGFGSGLLIMGVMTQFADAKTLIPQVALVTGAMVLTMLVRLRGHLRWRDALPLCLAVLTGTFVGAFIFFELPSSVVRRIVGAALILASLMGLVRPGLLHFLRRRTWAYPLGFLGGCMSVFNTSGPPLIHYAYAQDWTVQEKKMILQAAFFTSAVIRLTHFTAAGLYTARTLWLPLLGIPIGILGILAGHALSRRLQSGSLARIVYALLIVLGVLLVARARPA